MTRDGGRVTLELRRVSSLLPHEETIEASTREMVAQLRKDRVQRDPIIVDGQSGVVLDGMHRLSAFLELGVGYAVCNPVDYSSPEISLGRWLRAYAPRGDDDEQRMLAEVGFEEVKSKSSGLEMLDGRKVQLAAFSGDEAFLPQPGGDIENGFDIIRDLDREANAKGWNRTLAGDDEMEPLLKKGRVVILIRQFDKRDVLNAGLSARPFPCKTSMHIVDPRPVAANIPLTELQSGTSKTLDACMERGGFKLLPGGSTYEGRRYKERLLKLSGI